MRLRLQVRLMIDAEQTYMQPAIDHIVLHLQRKYNHGKTPVVFNTYQAYLTDAYDRLVVDLERSQREGFTFACKLVRGAYMNQERDIAKKAKVESPVWAEEHETHESYHRCMDELVDHHDHSEVRSCPGWRCRRPNQPSLCRVYHCFAVCCGIPQRTVGVLRR